MKIFFLGKIFENFHFFKLPSFLHNSRINYQSKHLMDQIKHISNAIPQKKFQFSNFPKNFFPQKFLQIPPESQLPHNTLIMNPPHHPHHSINIGPGEQRPSFVIHSNPIKPEPKTQIILLTIPPVAEIMAIFVKI